jgi:hypothetical protein
MLFYGANTPTLDRLTNDANLQDAQNFFLKLGAGAAAVAGGAYLLGGAAASLGLLGETAGADAATNAPGMLARLLADTAGAGETTGLAKTGMAVAAVVVGTQVAAPGLTNQLAAFASELPTVAPEMSTVATEVEEAGPSIPEQAATMFQDIVRQAATFLRANTDLITRLGGSTMGAPPTANQVNAAGSLYAQGAPGLARALSGNALEAVINAVVEDLAPGEFEQLSGPNRIDFIGKVGSAFEGLSFEITTEAGVAGHVIRAYMQRPGAMIFTYDSIIP